MAQLVADHAVRMPDHVAVVDVTGGHTLTWVALDQAASAEAARLRRAGVVRGDRVLVSMRGGSAFCVAVLGALRANAVVVPYGPMAVARELDLVLADCHPAVVVAAVDDDVARGSAAGVGAALLAPPHPTAAPHPDGGEPDDEAVDGGEAIALLVYTSGAESSRGVRLSHRALLANRAQTAALRPSPVTSVDRVLLSLPLSHIFGLAAGLFQVCWAGATVVITEGSGPAEIAEVLLTHRVSALAGVPSMFRALLDLPPDDLRAATASVRLCTSGGAPLPPEWLVAFQEVTGLAIVEGYGLTEAGPVVTTNPPGAPPKPGSVGRALPGVQLRLVDADGRPLHRAASRDTVSGVDDGTDLDEALDPDEIDPDEIDPDEIDPDEDGYDTGLVAVRGPNLFSGYWPDGAGGPDSEGWFTTADIGYFDAEGDLHLVGRATDVVNVNGFNVYPREVEQVLLSIEGVTEAAVIGQRDERAGEVVRAVLVTAPAAALDEAHVRAFCAQRLARFKVPAVITFADALPRTPTGKIARRKLATS